MSSMSAKKDLLAELTALKQSESNHNEALNDLKRVQKDFITKINDLATLKSKTQQTDNVVLPQAPRVSPIDLAHLELSLSTILGKKEKLRKLRLKLEKFEGLDPSEEMIRCKVAELESKLEGQDLSFSMTP